MTERPSRTRRGDRADAALLSRLSAIVDVLDPVPDHVREIGPALFGFRNPDAALMELVEVDASSAAVRGTSPSSRLHFFQFGEFSIDIELTSSGAFCDVVGVVADPAGTENVSMTLETTSASFTTASDADGRFEIRQVPTGMVRLSLVRPSTGGKVTTPWFEVD
jgi:hypothetical protein